VKRLRSDSENSDLTGFSGSSGMQPSKTQRVSASAAGVLRATNKELRVGSSFAGRYQIIEELGKGGMGKVYKALDTEIEEKVALKLLNSEVAGDERTIQRFRNELKFARKISHRNICRMYDLSKDNETYYITMEYVPGEDLKSSIRRIGPLSAGKAVLIAKQVCEGLAEAHRLGVIHRDLKPQNIMVDNDGNARIMDFGIARSLKKKGITETGVIIGTPEYMSVEQVEGKEADQRSDIYSLGVILYEMVTGRVPFQGDTPLSIAVKHTTEAPEDPREVNVQIPEDLSRLILKCMEKDKQDRYQSAQQLLAELSEVEKDIPTTQKLRPARRSLTSTEITVRSSLRNVFIPVVAVVASAIMGVILWQVLSHKGAVPLPVERPSLAILRFENKSGDRSLDHWRSGISELLITDLGQSKFVRVLSGERIFSILKKLNLEEVEKYSSTDLKKVATLARVGCVLEGSYFTQGEDFVMVTILQEPHTGRVISSRRVRCRGEKEIPAKIDELTSRIKLDLSLAAEQISGDIDRRVAMITTGSVEAYKYYVAGWENHLQKGNPHETIEFMQKATAVDPEFALAYRAMAEAYSQLDSVSLMWNCLRKASELRGRLSRREYHLILGELNSMSEETYGEAIEEYNRLLELYPRDWDGNCMLGCLLSYDLERWDEAVRRFEVLIGDNAETSEPYVYQAEAYMALGMYDKAREVLRNCLSGFPEEVWVREKISTAYVCQRRLNLALKEAQETSSVRPSLLGDIYHYRGDLAKAEKQYQKLLAAKEPASRCHGRLRLAALYLLQARFEKSKEQLKLISAMAERAGAADWNIWSHSYLAQLHLASGQHDQALEEHEAARKVALEQGLEWQPDPHLEGMIYLSMRLTDQARQAADELKKTMQTKTNKKLMRYHHHLMGMIELQRENYPKAIAYFRRALALLPLQHSELDDHALFIYPLALAFYEAGNLENAQEQFKRMTALTTGRLFFGNMFAKSLYMLGKIYQEKGRDEKAAEHYARFIELWKDADTGIAEVEDAKKRLARLERETQVFGQSGDS
jgi:serine/threonine protein kinase/tetratricopeptide (TPR) repeat protein